MSGPVAGAPVVHGPPTPGEAPARAEKAPEKPPGGGGSSASGSASGSSASGSGSGAPAASQPAAAAGAALPGGSVPSGTVARIAGLKAAQELNGELCQLLRPAENAPDRIVVRTRNGEKSLRPANLEFAATSVYPRWALAAAAVLAVLSMLSSADVLLGSRSPLAAAAVPVLAMLWLLGTVGVLFWVYRPCRTPDVWVPSVSELGMYSPMGHAYRIGFIHVALLLATSIWLYSELLLPRLAEPPAPGTPWQPNAALLEEPLGHAAEAEAAARELEGAEREEELEAASEEAAASGEAAEAEGGGRNVSNVTGNMTAFLTWAPNRSVSWGYLAAGGVALQGLATFDGRVSLRSTVHLAGMGAFAVGTMQHSMQSTMVLVSARGKPLAALSKHVRSSFRLRQNITNYGPLVLLGVPLGSQFMNMNKPANQRHNMKSAMNIVKESGIIKLVGLLQWALVAIYAFFYSTFCVDFWFASQMP